MLVLTREINNVLKSLAIITITNIALLHAVFEKNCTNSIKYTDKLQPEKKLINNIWFC